MENPLVTVIVAVRNGERFIGAALDSIFAQEYRPIEVVVVDGRSTDRTVDIATAYEGVRCVNQTGKGVADAYNLGIASANGEILAFLSHDDLWEPQKLRLQVDYLLAHPEVDYCTAKASFFLEPGFDIPPGFRPELLEGEHVAHIMETLVVRKSLFAQIGLFNTQLNTAEDVDWFARARDRGIKTAVIPQVLLHKRVHDANISMATENDKNLLQALRKSIARKRALNQSGSPD